MNDEQYAALKTEPTHLVNPKVNIYEVKEREHNEREHRERTGERYELITELNATYQQFGPGSTALDHKIYEQLFYNRFGIRGTLQKLVGREGTSEIAPGYKLERLHQVWERVTQPLIDEKGEEKYDTLYDFTGFDKDGEPELFSGFLERTVDNAYKGIRRKAQREESKTIYLDEIGGKGTISYDLAVRKMGTPRGKDFDDHERGIKWADITTIYHHLGNYNLPRSVTKELMNERETLMRTFPQVGWSFYIYGDNNASNISNTTRHLLGQRSNLPPERFPRDRKVIGRIISDHRIRIFDVLRAYVITTMPQNHTTDDVDRAVKRVIGFGQHNKPKKGYTFSDKMSKEQQLGWVGHKIGGTDPRLDERDDWQRDAMSSAKGYRN